MAKYFSFLLLGLFVLTPLSAAAQFGPIVPEVCKSCACGFGGVMAIIQNVVNFIIAIAIIIATLIMVWAGGLYIMSSTNPESRSTANKMLLNAVIGILIVLSAWLVVDFVMKTLYDNGSEFGPWNTILLGGEGNSCIVKKVNKTLFGDDITSVTGIDSTTGGNGSNVVVSGTASHTAAAEKLRAAGISISSSGNCSDKNNNRCTSLDGMKLNTIDQAIAIKQACGCSVVVTGGTETGHAAGATSHSAGYKIDLGVNTQLDAYIRSLTPSGSRGSDSRYKDRCGNEYVRETSPNHWDITVTAGVCSPPK